MPLETNGTILMSAWFRCEAITVLKFFKIHEVVKMIRITVTPEIYMYMGENSHKDKYLPGHLLKIFEEQLSSRTNPDSTNIAWTNVLYLD